MLLLTKKKKTRRVWKYVIFSCLSDLYRYAPISKGKRARPAVVRDRWKNYENCKIIENIIILLSHPCILFETIFLCPLQFKNEINLGTISTVQTIHIVDDYWYLFLDRLLHVFFESKSDDFFLTHLRSVWNLLRVSSRRI